MQKAGASPALAPAGPIRASGIANRAFSIHLR
jgi:hypothetical protein